MKKSPVSYLLIFLIMAQTISALPAGWAMISDPSGAKLGMATEMLNHSPFPNFLIPGIILLIILGLFPAFIFYGLIKMPTFKLADKLNLYKKYHWAWTFSFYFGIILVMWINLQLFFLKEFFLLQFIYSTLGVLIIVLTHLPSTKRDYKIKATEQL